MKHNITGLDKAQLLLSLYDNARNSDLTKGRMEQFPRSRELTLDLEKAKTLLSGTKFIDYIGAVSIKIDFSEDEICTADYDGDHYDGDHNEKGGVDSAAQVISSLTAGKSTSMLMG